MPPYEPVFKVVESECAGVSLEKLSMESIVATYHDYVIHIVGIHMTLIRPDYQRPTLAILHCHVTVAAKSVCVMYGISC